MYLFEELWMRPDYWTLHAAVPEGYQMTEYWKLTHGKCDGTIAPDGCSGLAVVSKYPIVETEFYLYRICGNPSKVCNKCNTVHIGFCDYGLSGQSGFSDRKPLDGPSSVHK